MPPVFALILTTGFIALLFRWEEGKRSEVSKAVWLPTIWFFLLGSRYVTHWLATLGFPVPLWPESIEDGSPLDRLVFLGLILAGVRVLHQRRVTVGRVLRNNRWLMLFLIYGFIAVLWSDYPFVSLKRWVKVLGHPIMALIVLTEGNVEAAITKMMKRCAFLILPLSILFLKYFPHLGRGYESWTGQPINVGVTMDKNALGYDCMILGYFFVWRLLRVWPARGTKTGKQEIGLCLGFLGMVAWLFSMANSKTPLISLMLGIFIMIVLGLRKVDKRNFGVWVLGGGILLLILQSGLGIYERFLHLIGRNPTLTDRTILWAELLEIEINPLLGTGYESFWLGSRLDRFREIFSFVPNQAHNGYLETYLNLGMAGLALLIVVLIATFRQIQEGLLKEIWLNRFRMGLFFAIVLYNWTEATFRGLHLVWFFFYLIAMRYPVPEKRVMGKKRKGNGVGWCPSPAKEIGAEAGISGIK